MPHDHQHHTDFDLCMGIIIVLGIALACVYNILIPKMMEARDRRRHDSNRVSNA